MKSIIYKGDASRKRKNLAVRFYYKVQFKCGDSVRYVDLKHPECSTPDASKSGTSTSESTNTSKTSASALSTTAIECPIPINDYILKCGVKNRSKVDTEQTSAIERGINKSVAIFDQPWRSVSYPDTANSQNFVKRTSTLTPLKIPRQAPFNTPVRPILPAPTLAPLNASDKHTLNTPIQPQFNAPTSSGSTPSETPIKAITKRPSYLSNQIPDPSPEIPMKLNLMLANVQERIRQGISTVVTTDTKDVYSTGANLHSNVLVVASNFTEDDSDDYLPRPCNSNAATFSNAPDIPKPSIHNITTRIYDTVGAFTDTTTANTDVPVTTYMTNNNTNNITMEKKPNSYTTNTTVNNTDNTNNNATINTTALMNTYGNPYTACQTTTAYIKANACNSVTTSQLQPIAKHQLRPIDLSSKFITKVPKSIFPRSLTALPVHKKSLNIPTTTSSSSTPMHTEPRSAAYNSNYFLNTPPTYIPTLPTTNISSLSSKQIPSNQQASARNTSPYLKSKKHLYKKLSRISKRALHKPTAIIRPPVGRDLVNPCRRVLMHPRVAELKRSVMLY